MTTYCDINTCEDCPRYCDDCDGDKRVEYTDLISRADAIEAVKDTILKRFNLADWYEEMLNCGVEIEDRIKALPSADAEPKRVLQGYCKGANTIQTIRHEELKQIANTRKVVESADAVQGEWEDREVFNETDDDHIVEEWQSARCSVCGKYHTTPYMYYFDDFNFCPNCGARMKGGAE